MWNNYEWLSCWLCPAGCGPCGSCKNIGALSYALADFFRINLYRPVIVGEKYIRFLVSRRELLPSKIRSYDPRPQHAREVDKLALETLSCYASFATYCRKPGSSRLSGESVTFCDYGPKELVTERVTAEDKLSVSKEDLEMKTSSSAFRAELRDLQQAVYNLHSCTFRKRYSGEEITRKTLHYMRSNDLHTEKAVDCEKCWLGAAVK